MATILRRRWRANVVEPQDIPRDITLDFTASSCPMGVRSTMDPPSKVPKFSFRPPQLDRPGRGEAQRDRPGHGEAPRDRSGGEPRQREEERHRRKRRHAQDEPGARERREQQDGYRRHRRRDHSERTTDRRTQASSVPLPEHVYFDSKGDSQFQYGPDRSQIPSYRRVSAYVLGDASGQQIDSAQSHGKIVMCEDKRTRTVRPLSDQKPGKDGERLLPAKGHGAVAELDYMPHEPCSGPRSSMNWTQPASDLQAEHAGAEPHEQPETPNEAEQRAIDARTRAQELLKTAREHADEAQPWLDLIDYQEDLYSHLNSGASPLGEADRSKLADIRLDLYKQALRSSTMPPREQAQLWLGRMAEGSRRWDAVRQASEWQHLLAKLPGTDEVWIRYLDYVQTSFVTFEYRTCFDALREAWAKLGCCKTYAVLRLTSMMRDAGYREHALAIWQALLEFHICRPSDAGSSHHLTEAFQAFWESEVPRIGEPDAQGWKHFAQSGGRPPSIAPEAPLPELEAEGPLGRFYPSEMQRSLDLRCPGRSVDELGADDCDHFADIQLHIPQDFLRTSFADAEELLNAFLCFSRLPPLPRPCSCRWWWQDPFLSAQTDKFAYPADTAPDPCSATLAALVAGSVRRDATADAPLGYDATKPASAVDSALVRRVLALAASAAGDDLAHDIDAYRLLLEYVYSRPE